MTVAGRNEDSPEVAQFRIKQAMQGLEETIRASLRVGDVAAKYSDTQFVILLPNTTKELAMLVANRLISKLHDTDAKYMKVNIKINIEKVSMNGKLIH